MNSRFFTLFLTSALLGTMSVSAQEAPSLPFEEHLKDSGLAYESSPAGFAVDVKTSLHGARTVYIEAKETTYKGFRACKLRSAVRFHTARMTPIAKKVMLERNSEEAMGFWSLSPAKDTQIMAVYTIEIPPTASKNQLMFALLEAAKASSELEDRISRIER